MGSMVNEVATNFIGSEQATYVFDIQETLDAIHPKASNIPMLGL